MSCSDCLTHRISSSDYFQTLAAMPRAADGLPISGSLELTPRCNLKCRHCYIPRDHNGHEQNTRKGRAPERRPPANGELTFDEIHVVLGKLADAGVLSLLLTGGEVFLRRDFRKIYLHARKLGFIITLFTNATLVDASLADFLSAHPPRRIEVTIYGHTAQTYETVTQTGGSFNRFRQGVQRLLDRKLPIHFKAMVLQSNAHEFDAIRAWAEARGPFRYDPVVSPGLGGESAPLKERLPANRVAEILQRGDPDGETFRKLRSFSEEIPATGALVKCGAGTRTFHIDWQGNLHPCMMLRIKPYALLNGSISEWNTLLGSLRSIPAPPESLCNTCPRRFVCSTCAATSLLETGRAGMEVQYFCDLCVEREKIVDSASSGLNFA